MGQIWWIIFNRKVRNSLGAEWPDILIYKPSIWILHHMGKSSSCFQYSPSSLFPLPTAMACLTHALHLSQTLLPHTRLLHSSLLLCPSLPTIHRAFPKVELLPPSSHYVPSQHLLPPFSLPRETAECQGTAYLYKDTDRFIFLYMEGFLSCTLHNPTAYLHTFPSPLTLP